MRMIEFYFLGDFKFNNLHKWIFSETHNIISYRMSDSSAGQLTFSSANVITFRRHKLQFDQGY